MSRKRQIRRGQTVSPFGVGAIYDFGDESFVAKDATTWKGRGDVIALPRLAKCLGVARFLAAPTPAGRFDKNPCRVPYFRFPCWLFCARCRRTVKWKFSSEVADEPPTCPHCNAKQVLVPMRFVMVCKQGHLGDVPWDYWAHSNTLEPRQKQCRESSFAFESLSGMGGGLNSVRVRCLSCGAQRSLEGIVRKNCLQTIGVRCTGRQPWQSSGCDCAEVPQVVQRGASNVYYARVESALDIPNLGSISEDDPAELRVCNHPLFVTLKQFATHSPDPASDPAITTMCAKVASDCGCSSALALRLICGSTEPSVSGAEQAPTMAEILDEEWQAFVGAGPRPVENRTLVVEDALLAVFLQDRAASLGSLSALGSLISRIVLVKRLREVRALKGFERYEPGTMVKPWLDTPLDWLPAVEVFGEGIFLSLDERALQQWQELFARSIESHLGIMRARHLGAGLAFLPEPTARFVLLHTLAHLLIRRLSFECGYAASSLRERIYSREPSAQSDGMAGVLIYTADSDAEGSLGGLVRRGEPSLMLPSLGTMLQSARWCSSDPICSELPGQGLRGLNKAACHACALVPETSCLYCNTLLDRSLLVGSASDAWGYFSSFLNE